MNTLSDEQLKELEGLYQKATSGPWPDPDTAADMEISDEEMEHNRRLVYALHNAFPDLLSTIQSLRTELAASQKLVERLTEKLDDIREALPEDSPSHRADITGQTMAEDVSDLVKANDGFQKLCGELRTELAAAKEREQGLREALQWYAGARSVEARIQDNGERAEQALSQPPQSPWRPIAEAPKDGTDILLWTCQGMIQGYWLHGAWDQSIIYSTYDGAGGPAFEDQPTHWQPLPQPPTKGGESHD